MISKAVFHTNVDLNAAPLFHRPMFQILLIVLVVFSVFFSGISAEYSLVDDADTVKSLMTNNDIPLKALFLPKIKEGGYYRPLIGLSQYIDNILWKMDSRVVHLENICFHLVNALWTFLLVRLYVSQDKRNTSLAPLMASLLFALHPIVTESVNWYSGRTDLMASSLVLPAICALAAWKDNHKAWLLISALLLMLLSVLAKESVVAVLIALPLLLKPLRDDTAHPASSNDRIVYALFLIPALLTALWFFKFWPAVFLVLACRLTLLYKNRKQGEGVLHRNIKADVSNCILYGLLFLSACGVFFGVRHFAFSGRLTRIGATFSLMFQDTDYSIGLFLGALGFYAKKFFFPIPLNFAIREIDPGYQLLGIILLFMAVALFLNRTQWSRFVLVGIILLFPAMPFVFGTIAWTSYAERYMYLSTVFWGGAVGLYVDRAEIHKKILLLLVFVAIVAMAAVSSWRSAIWQSNVTLLADTVKRSPDFKDIRGFYMMALFLNNDLKSAEEQYHLASSIPSVIYNPKIDIVYAKVLQAQGKNHEARQLLEVVVKKTKGTSPDAANALLELKRSEAGTTNK